MHQTRQTTKRTSGTRGAAMVEAVVLLPVLLLLLLGVSLVAQRVGADQEAMARARDCAHRYSRSGCSEVPEGCEGVVSKGGAARSDGFDEESGPIGQAFGAITGVIDALSTLPFVGEAVERILGTEASAAARVREAPVTLFDPKERVVVGRGALVLPCNEKPTNDGLGDALWDVITGEFF